MNAPLPADAWALPPPMLDHRVVPLPSRAKPRAVVRPLSSVKLEAVTWLWPDHIPAGLLTLVASRPGCGKTTLACDIGARVTTGECWPDGAPNGTRGSVIFWSQEDPAEVLRTRAQAAGADLQKFHVLEESSRGEPFSFAAHLQELEATVDAMADVRLLVLDPILGLIERGDGHDAANVRRSLGNLLRLCGQRGIGIMGLTHFAKGSEGNDPLERVLGSQAWGAMARLVWVMAKHAGRAGAMHDRLLIRTKSNVSRDGDGWSFGLGQRVLAEHVSGQTIHWGDQLTGDARALLAEAEAHTGDAEPARNDPDSEVIAFLQEALADGPKGASDIQAECRAAGLDWWRVKKVKARAGVISSKNGMTGFWTWHLREGMHTPETRSLHASSHPFTPLHAPTSFPPFSGDEDMR